MFNGWDVTGPRFKDENVYLDRDGDNPEAPHPGYGWPLGSECWYFHLEGFGWSLVATGLTPQSALDRAVALCESHKD